MLVVEERLYPANELFPTTLQLPSWLPRFEELDTTNMLLRQRIIFLGSQAHFSLPVAVKKEILHAKCQGDDPPASWNCQRQRKLKLCELQCLAKDGVISEMEWIAIVIDDGKPGLVALHQLQMPHLHPKPGYRICGKLKAVKKPSSEERVIQNGYVGGENNDEGRGTEHTRRKRQNIS
ncbi:hypothetical protein ACH5RR_013876 [Cinchona calisaya]|uniref:Uncharacterized protein n=1 Tax=Cinchona calisaya TaxID=153742 RepID=A0ABD3A1F1_9GENT